MGYMVEDLTNMHVIYGFANCNTVLAVRLYSERFPSRPVRIDNFVQKLTLVYVKLARQSLQSKDLKIRNSTD